MNATPSPSTGRTGTQLDALNAADLMPIVTQAIGQSQIDDLTWNVRRLAILTDYR